ncbi:hypothetical protein CRE_18805 [Caenorhabditis remanei]|uniref:Serpentine receptor class gamma n=1 Tax=Caenorhabditis remanei TaxID=31234 RepID=E3LKI3_CAERE|nr:hypothetical protein CRE_18805 [Caenorhabditis remanei]
MSSPSESLTFPWFDPPGNTPKEKLAIVQLAYGIPTIIFMLFLFVFLGCSKKYSGSFYRLVQVDLLTNILCWLNTWISLRSMDLQLGIVFVKSLEYHVPGLWNISSFLINFFMNMQFCSAASMSLHRLSSILLFNHYEKFWSRFYIPIAIVFCFYSCLPQIGGETPKISLVNDTLLYTFNPRVISRFTIVVAIFSVVYFILLLSLGISVSIIASNRFQEANVTDVVSKKLTKIALSYGFVYSGILGWTILNTVQGHFKILPDSFTSVSYTMMVVASDLVSHMTLALPYILLIFDSNIKNDLRKPKEWSSAVVAST